MKIKTTFFNKRLIIEYLSVLSVFGLFLSFVFISIDIPDDLKCMFNIILGSMLLIIYLVLFIRANTLKKVKLHINNSDIIIKEGDILQEKSLKVIPFNEYFDTIVDNKIISELSLNGKYIKNNDLTQINQAIDEDEHLAKCIIGSNESRKYAKNEKFKLGTICVVDDYLLTAFACFDDENRAYLYINQYIDFLLNFWNEIDIVYSGRSISIPLFGSGITRHLGYENISEQELLELIIWSFKVSKIKFKYPSKVSIIIHNSIIDKIDFYKLKKGI